MLLATAAFFAQLTPAYRGWEVSGGFFAMTAVALLALVAWDEAPVVEVEVDLSRGVLPRDAY